MQKKNITGKEENNPQAEKYMQVLSKLKSMDSLNESKSASSNNLSTGKAVFGSQNWLDRTPSEPRTHTSSILTEKPTISQLPKKMSFLGSQNINASHMGSIMGSMLLGSSEKLQVPGLLPERLNNFKRVRRASMFPTMTNIPDQEDSHEPLRQSAQQLAGKTTDSHQSLEIQESTHSEEAVDQVVEFKQPAVYFEDPETRFSQSGRRRSLLTGVENMPELLSSKRRTSVVETEVQLMQVHVSDELEDSVPESLPFSDENKTSDKKQGVSESKSLGEMSRKSFGESQKSFSESHTRRRHVILQRAGSQSSADSQSNNEDKSMKALTLLSEKRKAFNKTRVAATANVAVPQMPSEYVDPDILEAEEQIRNWERLKEEMRIEKQAQPHKFKTVQDVVEVARDLRRLGMDVALINRCDVSSLRIVLAIKRWRNRIKIREKPRLKYIIQEAQKMHAKPPLFMSQYISAESVPILSRVANMYASYLGSEHQKTKECEQYLHKLTEKVDLIVDATGIDRIKSSIRSMASKRQSSLMQPKLGRIKETVLITVQDEMPQPRGRRQGLMLPHG